METVHLPQAQHNALVFLASASQFCLCVYGYEA